MEYRPSRVPYVWSPAPMVIPRAAASFGSRELKLPIVWLVTQAGELHAARAPCGSSGSRLSMEYVLERSLTSRGYSGRNRSTLAGSSARAGCTRPSRKSQLPQSSAWNNSVLPSSVALRPARATVQAVAWWRMTARSSSENRMEEASTCSAVSAGYVDGAAALWRRGHRRTPVCVSRRGAPAACDPHTVFSSRARRFEIRRFHHTGFWRR